MGVRVRVPSTSRVARRGVLCLVLASSADSAQAQTIGTLAGGGQPGTFDVQGLAQSGQDVFLAVPSAHRVLRMSWAGPGPEWGTNFVKLWQVAGTGLPEFSGDGGPAAEAGLSEPSGVALDAGGNLYVADTGNHRIRRIEAATGVVTTVAGTGTPGYDGDGGAAVDARLNRPTALLFLGADDFVVSDTGNHVLRRVTGGAITTIAGSGVPGYGGDDGPATAARLDTPRGLTLGSGSWAGVVYVADSGNHRIRAVSVGAGTIGTVAGDGTPGLSQLATPRDVRFKDGRLWVSDTGNHRIRIVSLTGAAPVTYAGTGAPGFSGDGGRAELAQFASPSAIALRGDTTFVADTGNGRVRRIVGSSYSTYTTVTTVAGSDAAGFSGDDGPAVGSQLLAPSDAAVDAAGNVFVADTLNHRVRRIAADTGVITTVAGDGRPGFGGDGGSATAARLSSPVSVALDRSGGLYVSDAGNRRVRRVGLADGVITTVAGTGVAATPATRGDGGPATAASLTAPAGLTVDEGGNLYVADPGDYRVRRVDSANGRIDTFPDSVYEPTDVAADGTGGIYVADGWSGGGRLVRVDTATGAVTQVLNPGPTSPPGVPAVRASSEVVAVALAPSGDIYVVTDRLLCRVSARTGVLTRLAGDDVAGFSGDGGPASRARLAQPRGLAVTSYGVFLADSGNDRVRFIPTSPAAEADIGVTIDVDSTGAHRVTATNAGPADALGVAVAGMMPVGASLALPISCTASAGSACGAASAGVLPWPSDLERPYWGALVDLLEGGSVTYVVPDPQADGIPTRVHTAAVSTPPWIEDFNPSNNQASNHQALAGTTFVLSPRGGETWPVGSSQIVTWGDYPPLPPNCYRTYQFVVLSDGEWVESSIQLPVTQRAFDLTVPYRPSVHVRVGVEEGGYCNPEGPPPVVLWWRNYRWALGEVSIVSGQPSELRLLTPLSGASWPARSRQLISWTGPLPPVAECPTQRTRVSFAVGAEVTPIADLAPGQSSFFWTVPDRQTTQGRVGVTLTSTCGAMDLALEAWSGTLSIDPPAPPPPVPTDFDANGWPDVLWHHQSMGDLYTWLMTGTVAADGAYLDPPRFADTRWQIRALADFDRDGNADVLWHHQVTGELYVWFLKGTVTVAGAYLDPPRFTDTRWQIRGAADFDGDGGVDLLWHDQVTGDLYLWLLDGLVAREGRYLEPPRVEPAWQVRGVADLNRDGRADLLWHHQVTGELYVWSMQGEVSGWGEFLDPSRFADTRWQIRRLMDMDGDGQPDILWHHQVTGELYVWFLEGLRVTRGAYLTPDRFADTRWQIVPR